MDVNGGEASLCRINRFFRGNSLFNESTAYLQIFNMFYISNTLDLTILRVYTETNYSVLYEVTDFFATGGVQLMALSMVSINSD